MTEKLLTSALAAVILGVKTNTLDGWRVRGCGPKFIKLGHSRGAAVRYKQADIEAWLASQTATSTTDHQQRHRSEVQHG